MNANYFTESYLRDSQKVYDEITAYPDDDSLWKVLPGISNPAGNLCLHLVGNLNHFIGALLGNTGYVRNRDSEFKTKGLSKDELLRMFGESQLMLKSILPGLTGPDLEKEYSVDFAGKHSTAFYLHFFLLHLNYHLGQINYHRRIINGTKS